MIIANIWFQIPNLTKPIFFTFQHKRYPTRLMQHICIYKEVGLHVQHITKCGSKIKYNKTKLNEILNYSFMHWHPCITNLHRFVNSWSFLGGQCYNLNAEHPYNLYSSNVHQITYIDTLWYHSQVMTNTDWLTCCIRRW